MSIGILNNSDWHRTLRTPPTLITGCQEEPSSEMVLSRK